ncbi:undecaprenyl-diphosphate phosphatase [Candidatus Uhrbacteria bacterium]|nr:undecaprenyl-diphosphate phosphatase [Candidatus Uhrbacteria bacterium]
MNVVQASILGLVEGVTEFLPVSSTGHLILASRFLGIVQDEFVKSFEIIIQLGAILAVGVLYAPRFWSQRRLLLPVIVGFLPTAVIGLVFYKLVKTYLLGNTMVVVASLAIGGVVMIVVEGWLPKHFVRVRATPESISVRDAVLIGIFQSIAIVPGVSRSAATIIGGLLLGIERKTAVEFSFLLAIPTMVAATALDLFKNPQIFSGGDAGVLAVGFIFSFITALLSIRWLLGYVKHHTFTAFGLYRITLAAFVAGVMLWS